MTVILLRSLDSPQGELSGAARVPAQHVPVAVNTVIPMTIPLVHSPAITISRS
jgi:hypothetical protein